MLRTLTAINKNGVLETKTFAEWAVCKGVSIKYLRQRKRSGFTDNETVNLPYGKSPRQMTKPKNTNKNLAQLWDQFLYKRTGEMNALR